MNLKKLLLTMAALSGLFIAQNASATCSNYTTYADGQVLTASSLNSLQTNYTNCVNAVLDGDTFTGNMLWHSGTDILMYSDTGSTLKASIDGASGATIAGLTQEGQSTNCGMSISGSTFSINGYDGSALSATNPCVVAVRSSTNGRIALAYFTSNVTFTFSSTSNTDGNDWGVTNTADWGSVMPFFIGVIYDGTTPYFTISRLPAAVSGAASTDLCQKDDTDCDAQTDVMVLTTGLTLGNWVNLPITRVGWFQMTYATSGSAWTATLSSRTGFNDAYEAETFTMPSGQNGAASGKYLKDNGGTAPVFTTNVFKYKLNKQGVAWIEMIFDGDGGTDGSGAVRTQIAAPYANAYSNGMTIGMPQLVVGGTTYVGRAGMPSASTTIDFVGFSAINTETNINHSAFTNATSRTIVYSGYYRAL